MRTAKMYLPQCRTELTALELFDRSPSAAPPQQVDPAVWAELVTELRRVLADRQAGKAASTPPSGGENTVEIAIVPDGQGGELLQWSYVNAGDYDQNGEVGISDLTPIGVHFGKAAGGPGWATARVADGDGNGEVNFADVTPIGLHFGASCAGYNIYGRDGGSGPFTMLDSLALAEGSGGPPPEFSWPISAAYDEYMVAACDFAGIDSPVTPIVKPNTLVLDPAVTSIIGRSEDSVTLSGNSAQLAVGQVLVSPEGEGFLGIVEGVDTSGPDTVVTYTQGTLEDVFDYAEIDFRRAFRFDDIEHVEFYEEGIELAKAASSATGTDRAASDFGDITLSFSEHEFGASQGSTFYGVTLQGEVNFKLDITAELDVGRDWEDLGELRSCDFGMSCSTTGSVTAKVVLKKKWTGEARQIASMYGPPIVLLAGPVPVVFTPQLDLYMGLVGEAELAATFTPSVTMGATAGLRYTRAGGWDPYFDHKLQGAFGWEKTNVYGKLQLDLNLLSPQPTLKVYGVAGPYAKFHAPYFRVAAQLQANPPEFSVTGFIGARAYVGAEIKVLGRTLAKYEMEGQPVFDILFELYKASWPLFDSEMQFRIEWEAESADHFALADVPWSADPAVVQRPELAWWDLLSGAVGSVSGGHESNHGSLDEAPFVLWTEQFTPDSHGNPASGTVTVYVGKMLNPARYVVRQSNDWTWPVRIRRITVSGAHSRTVSFDQDVTLYKNYWDPLDLRTETGEFIIADPAEAPGYFPWLE